MNLRGVDAVAIVCGPDSLEESLEGCPRGPMPQAPVRLRGGRGGDITPGLIFSKRREAFSLAIASRSAFRQRPAQHTHH